MVAYRGNDLINELNPPQTITTTQLLAPRRLEDSGNTLWKTFNRVQENLTKGGLKYKTQNGRRNKTRAITSINRDIQLNKALWTLAEEMKKLKAA